MPVARMLPEISQSALQNFERCERLFELTTIRRESWPAPDPLVERPDIRRRIGLGDLFHRLVHLHARGQDIESFLALMAGWEDAGELERFWSTYAQAPESAPGPAVWSEQPLRVEVAGLRLVVRYDRLVRQPDGKWVILDWKTGRSFDEAQAASSWQTRLYRLALAKGGQYFNGGKAIAPSKIRVVYWHVPSGQAYSYAYSAAKLAEDEAAVAAMAARLRAGLENGFAPNRSYCASCRFASRCRLDEAPATVEIRHEPTIPTFLFPGEKA